MIYIIIVITIVIVSWYSIDIAILVAMIILAESSIGRIDTCSTLSDLTEGNDNVKALIFVVTATNCVPAYVYFVPLFAVFIYALYNIINFSLGPEIGKETEATIRRSFAWFIEYTFLLEASNRVSIRADQDFCLCRGRVAVSRTSMEATCYSIPHYAAEDMSEGYL